MATLVTSTDDGRLLNAALLFPVLTHLAVGDGAVGATPPDPTAHGLVHELGRAVYLFKSFVVEDPAGTLVLGTHYRAVEEVTDLLYFIFRFADDEALGTWTEFGLFGGDVAFIARGATLADGTQGGDDRAGTDVVLTGAYAGAENQTLTVTVSTGGGSGVAVVSWVSDGAEPPGSHVVTFGTPVVLGATGLGLVFTGGVDGVLSIGDAWAVHATRAPQSATFAADGTYDPVANPSGQVLRPGRLVRLWHVDPGDVKGAAEVDVHLVVAALNEAC